MSTVNRPDERIRNEIKAIIKLGYQLKIGDRVIDERGRTGTVYNIHEKYNIQGKETDKPWAIGRPYIHWDGNAKQDEYTEPIQYGAGSPIGYNILRLDMKEKYDFLIKNLRDFISVTERINMKKFINDLREEDLNDAELIDKYKISRDELDYLINCPIVKFAFS